MRLSRALAVAAACVIAATAAIPAAAHAALPPQGVYEACYPSDAPAGCAARLQRLGDAGFGLVLNYWMLRGSSSADVVRYVNAAHVSGVQVIWSLNDWWTQDPNGSSTLSAYPKLAADCGCTTNGGLADYIVRLAKDQPGTWGYYLSDEPDATRHDLLAAFNARVKAIDPGHPRLVVACGVCAGGDPTGSRAAPFTDLDSVLATDIYPVVNQGPDPAFARNQVSAGMKGLQAVTDAAGRDSAVVLQSFSWGSSSWDSAICGSSPANCRFPTADELAAQRDAALTSGRPRMILWYALFDVLGPLPDQRPSDWTPVPDPERRWHDLVAAAFAPEPQAAAPPVVTPPPAGDKLAPVKLRYDIRGRRKIGRLDLTGQFGGSSARLDLRSTRLRLKSGRRYLVRSCIRGGGRQRCRSRWYRRGGAAPRLSMSVARPAHPAADKLFTARLTVSVRGARGRLVRMATSAASRSGKRVLRVPARG
jgi:hypothetical protein